MRESEDLINLGEIEKRESENSLRNQDIECVFDLGEIEEDGEKER